MVFYMYILLNWYIFLFAALLLYDAGCFGLFVGFAPLPLGKSIKSNIYNLLTHIFSTRKRYFLPYFNLLFYVNFAIF